MALILYKGHFFYHNLNDHRKQQRVEKTKWCKGDEFQSAVPMLPLTVAGSFIVIFYRINLCYIVRSSTFNPNIKLIPLSHLRHQISAKLKRCFFSLRGQTVVTHSRQNLSLFSFTSK